MIFELFDCMKIVKMEDNEQVPLVAGVSPKLPDFWPHAVDVWIAQVEAQFRVAHISSSQTKFDLAVQKLDQQTAIRLQDLLINVPAVNPYEALKARLSRFTKSSYQRIAEFQDLPDLGDRRPSELLDEILAALAGIAHDGSTCPLVRYAFLSRLPVVVRSALTMFEDISLRELGDKADLVWSTIGVSTSVSAVSTPPPTTQRPRSTRTQTPGRRAGRSPSPPRDGSTLCFYHRVYADRANFCRAPCSWTGNAPAGGRRN